MGDNYWQGTATAVAQITTTKITNYDASTSYKLTVGGVVVSTVGTGGTVATTAAALAAAWNASTHAYCIGVTATAVASDTITLTSDTAGIPFVVASSVAGGSGTIGAATTGTANTGPNDCSTAANWSLGTAPANSENDYLRNNSIPMLWGLAQSGVTPAKWVQEQSYTGQVGLRYDKFITAVSSTGAITYDSTVPEYRPTYLAIGAAILRIGESDGAGSNSRGAALSKYDLGTTSSAISIYGSGTSADALPPVRIKDTNAASTLNVYGQAKVGVCYESPADTGQFVTIQNFGGQLFVGAGVTLATLDCQAGQTLAKNAPTTVRIEAPAKLTLAGSGTITTLEKRGELNMASSYTVTALKG